jgi:acetate kinase
MTGSQDMREIEKRAAAGDQSCRIALQVFTHRVRKYIGAYTAVMGGIDAIVFTAGIGENSSPIRHRSIHRFDYLGAKLDEEKNRLAKVNAELPVVDISADDSRVKILVIATDEESAIAKSCKQAIHALDTTKYYS